MFFSTMVRDVGKSVEPWGTEMPSVRESQFRQDKLQLLNGPAVRISKRTCASTWFPT